MTPRAAFARWRRPLIVTLACAALAGAYPAAQSNRSGIDTSTFDRNVRPQDDFFRYVNGGWLARTPIPPDKRRIGTFEILADSNREALRRILDDAAREDDARSPQVKQIGDFYASFLNEQAIEREGARPLTAELAAIDAIQNRDDLARVVARLQLLQVRLPIQAMVAPEPQHPDVYALMVVQGGLAMPDRDYYLAEGETYAHYREAYQTYAATLLKLAGDSAPEASAREALQLETDVAQSHWPAADSRDRTRTYNPTRTADLSAKYPGVNWDVWFTTLRVARPDSVIVRQPSAIAAASAGAAAWPLARWKAYLKVALLDEYAPYLSEPFVSAQFQFRGKTLNGQQENTPRWQRAVNAVDLFLGESLGRLYVERHFTADAKQKMERLIENLRSAFRQAIDEADWMTPATRQEAQRKLAAFRPHVGYPDKWRDYSRVMVTRDGLGRNVMNAVQNDMRRDLDRVGGAVDQNEWSMTPPTVNAYYSAQLNAIFFPAGILQPPYFDPTVDDAVNYGGIGAVIGHEMGHGFDDQGRKVDADGKLRDWWSADDATRYESRAARVAAQFDGYSALPGLNVNGKLTLGENIGDLTGLAIALRAYRLSLGGRPAPVIDGFTGEQRFFIGWAQVWRGKRRDDALRALVLSNPHSPEQFRGNGPLTNTRAFYDAFGVTSGDRMWVSPERRTTIW